MELPHLLNITSLQIHFAPFRNYLFGTILIRMTPGIFLTDALISGGEPGD
jgi:hypothetical protein